MSIYWNTVFIHKPYDLLRYFDSTEHFHLDNVGHTWTCIRRLNNPLNLAIIVNREKFYG